MRRVSGLMTGLRAAGVSRGNKKPRDSGELCAGPGARGAHKGMLVVLAQGVKSGLHYLIQRRPFPYGRTESRHL